MAATQFRVNEVFDIPTLGGLIAVGSTQGGEFVGIPRLCDEVSRQPIHVLGVEHPTPRTCGPARPSSWLTELMPSTPR
jgi:hypothetical protein